jgi:hypothetical protein
MILPAILSWLEQSNKIVFVSGFRFLRRDVWSLLQIAAQATEAKITIVIGAAMLLGDNVIDLVGKDRRSLRQTKILANLPRPAPYTRSLLRG